MNDRPQQRRGWRRKRPAQGPGENHRPPQTEGNQALPGFHPGYSGLRLPGRHERLRINRPVGGVPFPGPPAPVALHPDPGRYIAPSEPTIRRKLQSIDPDEVDRALGDWLAEQSLSMQAVAVDGKTLKGAKGAGGRQVHLLAALVHHEKVVIAQRQVDTKSNEITAFRPLLEPLALEGKVVTADAMHTKADHANFLVEEKKADYLFFVKENQKTLLEDIKGLAEEDFPPQGNSARPRPRRDRDPQDRSQRHDQ